MHTFTISPFVAPTLKAGESTFERYFHPLFAELRDCSFIVDEWRPNDIHPTKQELLARYRVASLNVWRRLLHVYRGKRFLQSFGFAIPDGYGRVFALALIPEEQNLRSCTYDGYQLDDRKLVAQSVASFLAFEGAWTFATAELRLVGALCIGLDARAALLETPRSLRGLIGLA